MELVSVIVPVYNSEKHLKKCLNSIINQKHEELDIILINDGSSDSSLSICRDYQRQDERIRVIDKLNTGVSNSRNRGIQQAKGKWICFVDSDDFIGEEYVSDMLESVHLSNADMAINGLYQIIEGKITSRSHRCFNYVIQNGEKEALLESLFGYGDVIRSRIETQVLGFPIAKLYSFELMSNIRFVEDVSIKEDTIFNLDAMYQSKKIVISNKKNYYYVIHNESVMERFHDSYSAEVLRYLSHIKQRFEIYGLDIEVYNIAVLKTYMLWLKLNVLHKDSGFSREGINRRIRESFYEKQWQTAFHNTNYKSLKLPYRVLKLLYVNKFIFGIKTIYWLAVRVLKPCQSCSYLK